MKILITGGTGFVGTAINKVLLELGHQTIRFDLIPPRDDDRSNFVQGDVRDRDALDRALDGVDAVVHLAAAHHDFGIQSQTFHDVNVGGTQMLCDLMQQHAIRNLMFYSSVAVYGENRIPPTETTTPNPQSIYGITKLLAETEVQKWCQENAANRALIIRPTVIFGPRNFENMFALIRQIDRGKFLRVGPMSNVKSLAYIDNIVNTTLDVWLDKQLPTAGVEIFNFVDLPDLTSWEIASVVSDALKKKPPRLRIPYFVARTLAVPFDLLIAMTGKNLPISSAKIRKFAISSTQVNAEKIHRTAPDVKRLTVIQAINETITWYQSGKAVIPNVNRRPPTEIWRSTQGDAR